MKYQKGQYYKKVGGDFGVYFDGKKWVYFECLGCTIARDFIRPIDRLQGDWPQKAIDAFETQRRNAQFDQKHNPKLHGIWLKAGKPHRNINNVTVKEIH